MDKNDVIKMLNDELSSKLDEATIAKLKNVKSKKEALSILEGASVNLSDDMLAAVSGGAEDDELQSWCIDKDCDGLWCPGFI